MSPPSEGAQNGQSKGQVQPKLSNYGQIAIAVAIALTVASSFTLGVEFKDITTLLASLIAGIVALSINETVAARKKAELAARLREQREQVYRELLDHMLQSFQGGPRRPEWEIRTQIALWGSPVLLTAYSNWRTLVNRVLTTGTTSTIPTTARRPLQEALTKVCMAARNDLEIPIGSEPTIEELAKVFFDDYV